MTSRDWKHMAPTISNRNRMFPRAKTDSTFRYNIEISRGHHAYNQPRQFIQRILAYILRFRSSQDIERWLTVEKLNKALVIIIIDVQRDDFKGEVHQIQHHGRVDQKSRLNDLSQFFDTKGILRVGGRLEDSMFASDAKHQMLPPYSHPVTKLVMSEIHHRNCHEGTEALLVSTRQSFWPMKGGTIARSVIHHCVQCARVKPKMFQK